MGGRGQTQIYVANFVLFGRPFGNINEHQKAFWGENYHKLRDSLEQIGYIIL